MEELYHHGVLGQRWGVRRYQNYDGSLTQAGQKRLDKYKRQQSKSALTIGRDRYQQSKNISAEFTRAANKAKNKGNQEKYTKYLKKSETFDKLARDYEVSTKKQLDKIRNMSYDEMVSEKNAVRLKKGAAMVSKSLLSVALLPTGTMYLFVNTNDPVTYDYRHKQLMGQKH